MSGRVYVIRSANAVKVGRAYNPAERLKTLQRMICGPLELYFQTEEYAEAAPIEKAAQRLLSSKRLGGEWFSSTAQEATYAVEKAVSEVLEGRGELFRLSLGIKPRLLERLDQWRGSLTREEAVQAAVEDWLPAYE